VRAAECHPWDARCTLYGRTAFPQMTNRLLEEEAGQLLSDFEAEMRRLDAA